MKPFVAFFSGLFVLTSSLSAHPTGHEGGLLDTARHFLVQADHLLVWGTALLLAGWLVSRAVRSVKAKANR